MPSGSARVATVKVRNKATGEVVVVHGAQIVAGYARALPRRGTNELLQAYSASPVLQAVVRKIASSMAAVQWVAKVRTPEGDKLPAPNHIAEKLINSGVPGLDGVQCRMLEQTFIELVGESFAIIDRNRMGAPAVRWPIPPHWVRNVPSPFEEVFEIIPSGGSPFVIHRDDMIWHKDADPFDPYRRGVGIARSLVDELNADEAAAKHTAASLTNRARPDIIISGSKEVPLHKDDSIRLSEVWGQRFSGPENAGKPFFSAGPITVQTLTPTFRELQLSKLREFERDIIIAVFGVPPEIMGIIENSNRATIESAEFLFSKYVLTPRLEARRATYNEQLAWQYDERLLIDFEDPVDENRAFKLEVFKARPTAFTDDETRILVDEEPLPVDDEVSESGTTPTDVQAAALNGAQIIGLQAIITQVSLNEIPPETAIQMILVAFPTIDESTAEGIVNPAVGFAVSTPDEVGALADEEPLPDSEGEQRPFQAAAPTNDPAPVKSFPREGRVKEITADDIAEIISALDRDLTTRVVLSNTRAAVAEFGADAMTEAGVNITFDLDNPRAVEFIDATAGERSNLINGTTEKNLRTTLSEGVSAGDTQRALIARVQATVKDATAARADMIARTETTRAAGFATEEGMRQSNLTEKEWLAVQDDDTRDTHREMDGQKQPVGESFQSPDGHVADYPGNFGIAGEDINCRCVVVAVDTLPDKAARVAKWHIKASQMQRLEATYARQLRSVFREQGLQVIGALENKA